MRGILPAKDKEGKGRENFLAGRGWGCSLIPILKMGWSWEVFPMKMETEIKIFGFSG